MFVVVRVDHRAIAKHNLKIVYLGTDLEDILD